VLVTLGIRSNVAALWAGFASTMLAGVAQTYLPATWGNFPPILFGLGAIAVARYPDGTLAAQARNIRSVWSKARHHDVLGVPQDPAITGSEFATPYRMNPVESAIGASSDTVGLTRP
jgi:branched-chain amino acid transport system permease protein